MSHDLNLDQIGRLQEALFAYQRLTLHRDRKALLEAHGAFNRCDGPTQDCLTYLGMSAALVDYDTAAP